MAEVRIVVELGELASGSGRLLKELGLGLARVSADLNSKAEMHVLLWDSLANAIPLLRAAFAEVLPHDRIRICSARALPTSEGPASDPPAWASLIREGIIASIAPSVLISANTGQSTFSTGPLFAQVRDNPSQLVLSKPGVATTLDVIDLAPVTDATGIQFPLTAARAVLDRLYQHLSGQSMVASLPHGLPRLAFVSPLLPAESGIARYSSDLLPELARWYTIDAVADQVEVSDPWVRNHARVIDPAEFFRQSGNYARVLYQMGNSGLHSFMLPLMELVPGVVMLHDFFLGHALQTSSPALLKHAQWVSHGAEAALCQKAHGVKEAISGFPSNLTVLQQAKGVIVHSHHARSLASEWYGPGAGENWAIIPILRRAAPIDATARLAARTLLGLSDDALVICSFGIIGPSKLSLQIVEAFGRAKLSQRADTHLFLVGRNDTGRYGRELLAAIAASGVAARIHITGWTDDALYSTYLQAADIAIQLRSCSRGETSAAVLDCMANGLPTVVNAHGSLAELDPASVVLLPEEVTAQGLAETLDELAGDYTRCATIGIEALATITRDNDPECCARAYALAIEQFYYNEAPRQEVLKRLARSERTSERRNAIAAALAWNLPPEPRPRQLLVDVSALAVTDLRTGVQRVVRSILAEWLRNPPTGWAVHPVCGDKKVQGFRYAQRWTEDFLGIEGQGIPDAPVDAWSGDIFLGLDLDAIVPVVNQPLLDAWFHKGVDVRFVVYDLLPIRLPKYFPAPEVSNFRRWLSTITRYSGAVCISQTVASDLRGWLDQNTEPMPLSFRIDSFRLGAEFQASVSEGAMPPGGRIALHKIGKGRSFLMVGTVEPRKGHGQALAAFESLWIDPLEDVCLVIVGKQGWDVDNLCDRLRRHPEAGRRLFWFDAASDAFLDRAYRTSKCLLMASEGEGFGLPLIEAARVGLPILARDLPEFREVAGDHAAYFAGVAPTDLAEAIRDWLDRHAAGQHPHSVGVPILTWAQSATDLALALGIDPHSCARTEAH